MPPNKESVADEWNANLLSKITFGWLFPLIKVGHERVLNDEDVGENADRDMVAAHLKIFEENLKKGTKETFRRTIIKSFSRLETYAVICKLVVDASSYVLPFSINYIVSYAENPPENGGYEIWLVAVFMFVSVFITAFCNHWFYQFVMIDGLHSRIAIQAAVYSKMMRINVLESGVADTITNLHSTDCLAIEMVYQMWMYLWSAPLQLVVTTTLLYLELGWPIFVGIGILVLNGPIQKQILGLLKEDTIIASQCSDRRIKSITEILQGIHIVKLQAWEDIFFERVENERTTELKHRRSIAFLNAGNSAISESSQIVSVVVTFIVYGMVSKEPLTAAKAFTALSLFNLLRLPLFILPMMLGIFASALIASKRLSNFFYAPELETYVQHEEFPENDEIPLVEIRDLSFSWQANNSSDETDKIGKESNVVEPKQGLEKGESSTFIEPGFLLKLDDIKFYKGTLNVIIGEVGSGKSSVLSALLGEMHVNGSNEDGFLMLRGSIGYCAQTPWIQNATLRENITFGTDFDEEKYEKVIEACALQMDISALPAGDLTEIGERGINLSGGQKARVSLARACYQDTDILILDDVLSAVDAHVGRTITDKCLVQLLRDHGKTVVLATHQTICLRDADNILRMKGGTVEALKLGDLPDDLGLKDEKSSDSEVTNYNAEESDMTQASIVDSGIIDVSTKDSSGGNGDDDDDAKGKGKLTEKEKMEEGAVTLAVYLQYLKLMGLPMCLLIILLALSVNGSQVALQWWLSRWSVSENSDTNYYLYIYLGIGLGVCVFIFLYQIGFVVGGMMSAAGLHKKLLIAILAAPMSFFDTTPSGQILNRFTVDMRAIDETLVKTLSSATNLIFQMGFVIGTMVAVVPWILVALVPLLLFYNWIQRMYRNTARELKRFDSASQSPIFNFFAETVTGLTSVRAFNCENRMLRTLTGHVDTNTRFWSKSNFVNRWLGIRLDVVGALLMGAAAISCVLALEFGWVSDAGLIGLVLTYTAALTGLLNWGVRNFSDAEMGMVAVERTRNMAACQQEMTLDPIAVPPAWPSSNDISFENVSVRYRDNLPNVLNGLDILIPGKTK